MKQCTSLLAGPTSILISPKNAYLHTLIIPSARYRKEACDRAFGEGGRMQAVVGEAPKGDYSFRPFQVKTTDLDFEFSQISSSQTAKAKASNISAAWTPSNHETLINGVRAGWKQDNPAGRSMLSRREMSNAVVQVLHCLRSPVLDARDATISYSKLKQLTALNEREAVKVTARSEALKGWQSSPIDDFELEHPGNP